MLRRAMLILLIAGTCIGCDRLAKGVAIRALKEGGAASYLGDALRLQYAENPGAMLSLGADLPPSVRRVFLTFAVTLILTALAVVVVVRQNVATREVIAAAMVIGGGFGNVIDRIMYDGSVIDFLNVGIGGLRTAVFNVADVAILTGTAVFLLTRLKYLFATIKQ